MARIPPSLLYLAIYNPTLRPSTNYKAAQPEQGDVIDEEDAEEHAHILFYTAKERAVSRDKMLRQVGLAKALVNFSEMFNFEDFCDNVHSQSRRMVMVSPEPDFYIHACIEVAKVLRPPVDKGRAKAKGKGNDKSKTTTAPDSTPTYEYIDGSVHDTALQASIMNGYDKFKLTHGSFSTILETLGQQALELQLERFWTVWAWSWNLEEGLNFEDLLGPPLHPFYTSLSPLVDDYTSQLGQGVSAILIHPPHSIPSTAYLHAQYPPSLAEYLISLVPPKPLTPPRPSTTKEGPTKSPNGSDSGGKSATSDGSSNTFFGIPPVNLDVRKWGWSGYLTFGKSQSKSTNGTSAPRPDQENYQPPSLTDRFVPPQEAQEKDKEPKPQLGLRIQTAGVVVDQDSLEDAISSHQPTPATQSIPLPDTEQSRLANGKEEISSAAQSLAESTNPVRSRGPEPTELPKFSVATVHLSPIDEPAQTNREVVHYVALRDQQIMLALLSAENDLIENDSTMVNTLALFKEVQNLIAECETKGLSNSIPSATNILQPSDRHILTSEGFTLPSKGFSTKAAPLYNAQLIQDIHPDVTEVFSWERNPQRWHVLKRNATLNCGSLMEGGVYLEVSRKDTSLTDVDNVLAGVIRKSGLASE
ncbi:hypothetical protein AX16_001729 [Volvariella volvacea WC 439]|nr:hypothetical protein AX16_001729 [Volvariella volvacea WC 439]